MPSYSEQLAKPAWILVDERDQTVASIRADTALEARDIFRASGMQGVRVKRANVAPVDQDAAQPPPEDAEEPAPAGALCMHCGNAISTATDYRIVTGYERIYRGQGGTNGIRCPDRSAESYACMWCVDKLANGLSPHQITMV
jgi:hypothetical protein